MYRGVFGDGLSNDLRKILPLGSASAYMRNLGLLGVFGVRGTALLGEGDSSLEILCVLEQTSMDKGSGLGLPFMQGEPTAFSASSTNLSVLLNRTSWMKHR